MQIIENLLTPEECLTYINRGEYLTTAEQMEKLWIAQGLSSNLGDGTGDNAGITRLEVASVVTSVTALRNFITTNNHHTNLTNLIHPS